MIKKKIKLNEVRRRRQRSSLKVVLVKRKKKQLPKAIKQWSNFLNTNSKVYHYLFMYIIIMYTAPWIMLVFRLKQRAHHNIIVDDVIHGFLCIHR